MSTYTSTTPFFWNADHHIAAFISMVFQEWLEKGPAGHPPELPYEVWVTQVKAAQEALDKYRALGVHPNEAVIEGAKKALCWIAFYLVYLWE